MLVSEPLTILATTRAPTCTFRIDKRLQGYHTIQFLSEGGVALAYDEEWYTLEGGPWFWPAFPGPRLRFHVAPGHPTWFHRHVGFQGPGVQRWIAAGLWPTRPQPAPPGRDWAAFFDELITQARRPDRWGRLRATCLLEQLVVELAEARVAPPPDAAAPWVQTVLAGLEDNAFAPDYHAVAQLLGISVGTLRRRFKVVTGLTLHEHVLQKRIARARTLLRETDLPLCVVAARLGYDNVYFFSRQFRQRVGAAPGAYRQSRQS